MSDLDALPSGRPAFDPAILMRRLTSLDAIFAEMKAIPTRSGPRRDLPIRVLDPGEVKMILLFHFICGGIIAQRSEERPPAEEFERQFKILLRALKTDLLPQASE